MINVTKLTVKVRFPNLFVSILNARHFENDSERLNVKYTEIQSQK